MKWIKTVMGDMINVDHIASISIEDFELHDGCGMIAAAYLTTGRWINITNPCEGDDTDAEAYPEYLISVLLKAPENSIINTTPFTDEDGTTSDHTGIPELFAAYVLEG